MVLGKEFFDRDCLDVAPELVGKILVHKLDNGEELRVRITETEAYRGEDDGLRPEIKTDKRVGIDYAGEEWVNKLWRFIMV